MNRLLTLFCTIIVTFLVLSCASNKTIEKRLIGTWKAVKIEPIVAYGQTVPTIENPENMRRSHFDTTANQQRPKEPSKTEQQLNRMVDTELRSSMTINADKTAVKEYPGKTVHASWKLKDKGRSLFIKTKETDRELTFFIQRINDTSAVFTATTPVGKFKVTYKKEKK